MNCGPPTDADVVPLWDQRRVLTLPLENKDKIGTIVQALFGKELEVFAGGIRLLVGVENKRSGLDRPTQLGIMNGTRGHDIRVRIAGLEILMSGKYLPLCWTCKADIPQNTGGDDRRLQRSTVSPGAPTQPHQRDGTEFWTLTCRRGQNGWLTPWSIGEARRHEGIHV